MEPTIRVIETKEIVKLIQMNEKDLIGGKKDSIALPCVVENAPIQSANGYELEFNLVFRFAYFNFRPYKITAYCCESANVFGSYFVFETDLEGFRKPIVAESIGLLLASIIQKKTGKSISELAKACKS